MRSIITFINNHNPMSMLSRRLFILMLAPVDSVAFTLAYFFFFSSARFSPFQCMKLKGADFRRLWSIKFYFPEIGVRMTVSSLMCFFSLLSLWVAVTVADAVRPAMYLFADVHYDPFYGTEMAISDNCTTSAAPTYGTLGCDSSPALMESAVSDLVAQVATNGGDGIVLYLGDVVRHELKDFEASSSSSSSASKHAEEYQLVGNITSSVFGLLASKLREASSQLLFHPSVASLLGNEDCVPHYHFLDSTEKSIHPALMRQTAALVSTGILSPSEGAMYGKCAFYSRLVPGTNLLIIAINTIVYSVEQKPSGQSETDPCGQLQWLSGELARARTLKQRVMIAGHIVPYAKKWVSSHRDAYRSLVLRYHDIISVQWFAHTHMFSFQTLSDKQPCPLLFTVPAITPRDGNVPSFVRVTFTDQPSVVSPRNTSSWMVDNIEERFYDVFSSPDEATWRTGKEFPESFPLSVARPMTTEGLYSYGLKLYEESTAGGLWRAFEPFHRGGAMLSPMSSKDKTKLLCDMLTASDGDYESCRGK